MKKETKSNNTQHPVLSSFGQTRRWSLPFKVHNHKIKEIFPQIPLNVHPSCKAVCVTSPSHNIISPINSTSSESKLIRKGICIRSLRSSGRFPTTRLITWIQSLLGSSDWILLLHLGSLKVKTPGLICWYSSLKMKKKREKLRVSMSRNSYFLSYNLLPHFQPR